MKRKKTIVAIFFLLSVGVLFAAWMSSGVRAPKFEGRSISELLDESQLLPNASFELTRAVHSLRGDAVPYLVHVLENEPTSFQQIYTRRHAQLPAALQRRLPRPQDFHFRRARAAYLLSVAGTNAVPALPLLARISKEDAYHPTRHNALVPLETLGPGSQFADLALEAMLRATRDTHRNVVESAYGRLGSFTNHYEQTLPVLFQGLQSPALRENCLYSLKRLGPHALTYLRSVYFAGNLPVELHEVEKVLGPLLPSLPGTISQIEDGHPPGLF